MALDPESTWQEKFEALPVVNDSSWADNMANLLDTLSSKLGVVVVSDPAGVFKFEKSLFSSAIKSLPPSGEPISGRTAIANAWQTAILASTWTPGATVSVGEPPSPANTFATATAVIDPSLVTTAYAGLLADLLAAPNASKPGEGKVPAAFRKAFLAIGFIFTGSNQLSPPTPLVGMATVE